MSVIPTKKNLEKVYLFAITAVIIVISGSFLRCVFFTKDKGILSEDHESYKYRQVIGREVFFDRESIEEYLEWLNKNDPVGFKNLMALKSHNPRDFEQNLIDGIRFKAWLEKAPVLYPFKYPQIKKKLKMERRLKVLSWQIRYEFKNDEENTQAALEEMKTLMTELFEIIQEEKRAKAKEEIKLSRLLKEINDQRGLHKEEIVSGILEELIKDEKEVDNIYNWEIFFIGDSHQLQSRPPH